MNTEKKYIGLDGFVWTLAEKKDVDLDSHEYYFLYEDDSEGLIQSQEELNEWNGLIGYEGIGCNNTLKLRDRYLECLKVGETCSFSAYVESVSKKEPDFYRWFFNNETISNYGKNLPCELKTRFAEYLCECDKYVSFDLEFNSDTSSNECGFKSTFECCKNEIEFKTVSYFKDYAGGSVSIVCNQTSETVYTEEL